MALSVCGSDAGLSSPPASLGVPPVLPRETFILLTHSAATPDKAKATFSVLTALLQLLPGTKDKLVNREGGSETVAKSATQYRGDGGYSSPAPRAPSTWKLSCVKPPGAYCLSEETRDRRARVLALRGRPGSFPPHKRTTKRWQNCLARGPSLFDLLRVVISPH